MLAACALACGSPRGDDRDDARAAAAAATAAAAPAAAVGAARARASSRSATASPPASGLRREQAYPGAARSSVSTTPGLNYEVVNAGVSGDTSAGGLERLDWALDGDVRVLIVALGGNDGLRGLPRRAAARNLSQIIERAQARGITVILAGMEAPPNYGARLHRRLSQGLSRRWPQQYHVPLVPFLLEGVAGIASLNQRDGIHPTAEGARIVADNVWAVLEADAASAQARRERPGS